MSGNVRLRGREVLTVEKDDLGVSDESDADTQLALHATRQVLAGHLIRGGVPNHFQNQCGRGGLLAPNE